MAGPQGRIVFQGRRLVVRFKMDRAGIAKCAMGKELRRSVHEVARDEAMPYAISISPRSNVDHVHYQDSFVVVLGTASVAAMRRVAARLFNVAPHAAAIEWGTKRGRGHAHRVLGKTLDHLNSSGPDQHN